MPNKIFMTQKTNRHIVKRLDSDLNPAIYDNASFGTYKIPGVIDSTLNFPSGITADNIGNIYVCDTNNKRIVKFDQNLVYIDKYDTIPTVSIPYCIMFDSLTGDLYITGIYAHIYLRVERITTALSSVKVSGNLNAMNDLWFKPTGIVRNTNDTLILSGSNLGLFLTMEQPTTFTTVSQQMISGEYTRWPQIYTKDQYTGIVKHTNGDLYLNDGKRILRVSGVTFENLGDSDLISETLTILKQGANESLLTYDINNKKIVRYDSNLNYLEDIYWHQLQVNYDSLNGFFEIGEEVRTNTGYGRGIITADNGNQLSITVIREGFNIGSLITGVNSTTTCNIVNIVNAISSDAYEIADLVEITI
jgi:hypothetical protein